MGLKELVESDKWRRFMGFVTGWGASVVIIGALFKIQHYPGASLFIVLGLGVEAVIFFFSAFEPPHKEVDWSIVYPELAGLEPNSLNTPIAPKEPVIAQQGVGGTMPRISVEEAQILEESFGKLQETVSSMESLSGISVAMDSYVENINEASEGLSSFKENSQKLSESTNSFSEIINMSASNFAEEMDRSTKDIGKSVKETSETLKHSNQDIAISYNNASEAIKTSSQNISDAYLQLSQTVKDKVGVMETSNVEYTKSLENVNKNLSALNAAYELQLNEANEYVKTAQKLHKGLETSIENSQKYQQESERLVSSISALSDVYGNMLNDLSKELK